MSNSFTGVLTAQALSEVLANPSLINVTSFAVSSVQGTLDPTRTIANPTWFTDTFNPVATVSDNKIEISMIIPPSSDEVPIVDGSLINELYLYANTNGGSTYLLAIIHPPDGNAITYSEIVNYQIDVEVQFSQGSGAGVFNFIYAAGDVNAHNLDLNAHQDRWVKKAGDTMTGALHQPNSVSKTSSGGVLTLDETSNSFIANGGETITSITGWTKGIAVIRWNTVRTLTYNATSLVLLRGTNRVTQIGDVGIYEFSATGCREIAYSVVGDYAKRLGDSSVNFEVANGVSNYDAVNYSQLISLQPDIYTTYSVNSAYRDSDGYADFINKVSDTEVSFDVDGGTSYENLVCTFPDGTVSTFESLANISSELSSDDTYYIIIEKGNTTASLCSGTITESYSEPATPSSGDYWLDISVKPYIPYKYGGGAWIETQFVKLGEVTKTGGILGTPISYALNGKSVIQSAIPSTALTNISFSHNIGSDCKSENELICISSEYGYEVGEKAKGFGKSIDGVFDSSEYVYKLNKLTGITHTTRAAGTLQPFAVIREAGIEECRITYSKWEIIFTTKRSF